MRSIAHVHLRVSDLARSRDFYARLFDGPPAKERPGYVQFLPAFAPWTVALSEARPAREAPSTVDHLGIRLDSSEAVRRRLERIRAAGIPARVEEGVDCCHARQDKFWVVDPDRTSWEVYCVRGEGVEHSFARPEDRSGVLRLLAESGLPTEDVEPHLPHFLLARRDGALAGAVGLEIHGEVGLLRSLAVAPSERSRGIGRDLCDRIAAYARFRRIRELCLLTTDAEGYFAKLGFERVGREGLPPSIQATPQFRGLCPSSAVAMRKRIEEGAVRFPREVLQLEPDVSGARTWGVSLSRAELAYFEVEPRTRFDAHRHDAEQITLVLEGELFFEAGGKTVRIGEGEAFAIPAGVSHAAFTRDRGCRAVDAWSPPRI